MGPTIYEAAQNLLGALHDDHENCYICGRDESEGHDPDTACGELAAALEG